MHRVLISFLLTLGLLSAAEPTSVSVIPERGQVAVGDDVGVSVVYRFPANATPLVDPPSPLGWFANIPLVAASGPEERRDGAIREVIWRLTLAPAEPGPMPLPQPQLTLAVDGSTATTTADPSVLTVGGDQALPLPPVQPARIPPAIATKSSLWLWLIGGLAVVTALAAAVWWWAKGRQTVAHDPVEEFDHLIGSLRSQGGSLAAKQTGSSLARAIRHYCGACYAFDGDGATVRETLTILNGRLDSTALRELRPILEAIDGLVWAPNSIDATALASLIDRAEVWVHAEHTARRTRAQEEAA